MKYGLFVPNFGGFGDARSLAELARDAEQAGWDGFFVWDHLAPDLRTHVVDPWVALAAIAMSTERLRIGPLVTPLPRRRPWQVARAAVSLDHLSGGRLVLGVGLGSGQKTEWEAFGEEAEPRRRGAMLDEALEIVTGLWNGGPVEFHGTYYRVSSMEFLPRPLQQPRIPIWVAGYWPHERPLRRAARWDGMFPLFPDAPPGDLEQLVDVVRMLRAQRDDGGAFDIAISRRRGTPREPAARAELVAQYAAAGATWWLDTLVPEEFGGDWHDGWPADAIRAHVRGGPPRG